MSVILELHVPTCVFPTISSCGFLLHLSALFLCATILSFMPPEDRFHGDHAQCDV